MPLSSLGLGTASYRGAGRQDLIRINKNANKGIKIAIFWRKTAIKVI
jgi:hypothetical protein